MKRHSGFTLIEVMLALAILAIAVTAILLSTSETVKDTAYLENKMIAHWVGLYVINEAEVGLIKVSKSPESASDEMTMMQKNWKWNASLEPSANKNIWKLHVIVSSASRPDQKLSDLTTYEYISHKKGS